MLSESVSFLIGVSQMMVELPSAVLSLILRLMVMSRSLNIFIYTLYPL